MDAQVAQRNSVLVQFTSWEVAGLGEEGEAKETGTAVAP